MTYPQRDSSSRSSKGSHRLICEMSVWFFWFFRRSAATEEARSGRAEVSDARRPRNRENGDDALTRAADARPRGRERGGALAVPLRDLRRSATRRGEKTRATGEAFGVDARRSPRRRGTGTRAYLGDPRVEIQTLPHDRPRASRDDSGPASASSRPREWFCGAARSREPPRLRQRTRAARCKPRLGSFCGAFHCARRPKQTRDKLAPIVGIIRDASETYSTLLTHAPSHDIRHENPLKERTP